VTGPNTEREAARVHWLIAGQFSAQPSGKSLPLTSQDFVETLAKCLPCLSVKVPDRFGDSETRAFDVAVGTLKALTLAGVVQAVPELKQLLALAARGSMPERDALVAELEKVVGPGKLSRACAAEYEDPAAPAASAPATPAPVAPAAPAIPAKPAADLVDSIFAKTSASSSAAPAAARALDAFVGATGSGKGPVTAKPAVSKKIRGLIEAAVYGTAHAILSSDLVRRLEGNWRGLKLLLEQCPPSAGMQIELLDVERAGLVAALRDHPREDSLDDPDVVFVTDAVDDVAVLTDLADLSDETLTPCVASITPGFFGAADLDALPQAIDVFPPEKKGPWEVLRGVEPARWLCLLVNPVVLLTEGSGETRHVCFGSPVWAMSSMLAASFKAQGSFARIVGAPGALRGGATWIVPAGKDKGTSAPTEFFLPIRAQTELGARGLVGLGSPKNTDQIMLTLVPMLSSAAGAAPLPGQILTGRIVRFTRWVRRQLGAGADETEVAKLFGQAADVFLFPNMNNVAVIQAAVAEQDGKRVLRVAAKVRASHALVPFEIEFGLPL
jgi:hypothetical protein